jgi:hypothetical protein
MVAPQRVQGAELFQKVDNQRENPFAKGFSPLDPFSENSHVLTAQRRMKVGRKNGRMSYNFKTLTRWTTFM